MIVVYVETNYVLELALIQETHQECEDLLQLCEHSELTLALPAYSLVEPYETLIRRQLARTRLEAELHGEVRHHSLGARNPPRGERISGQARYVAPGCLGICVHPGPLDRRVPCEELLHQPQQEDFDVPDIDEELRGHGCKMLFNFKDGRNYATHCIDSE